MSYVDYETVYNLGGSILIMVKMRFAKHQILSAVVNQSVSLVPVRTPKVEQN